MCYEKYEAHVYFCSAIRAKNVRARAKEKAKSTDTDTEKDKRRGMVTDTGTDTGLERRAKANHNGKELNEETSSLSDAFGCNF